MQHHEGPQAPTSMPGSVLPSLGSERTIYAPPSLPRLKRTPSGLSRYTCRVQQLLAMWYADYLVMPSGSELLHWELQQQSCMLAKCPKAACPRAPYVVSVTLRTGACIASLLKTSHHASACLGNAGHLIMLLCCSLPACCHTTYAI